MLKISRVQSTRLVVVVAAEGIVMDAGSSSGKELMQAQLDELRTIMKMLTHPKKIGGEMSNPSCICMLACTCMLPAQHTQKPAMQLISTSEPPVHFLVV